MLCDIFPAPSSTEIRADWTEERRDHIVTQTDPHTTGHYILHQAPPATSQWRIPANTLTPISDIARMSTLNFPTTIAHYSIQCNLKYLVSVFKRVQSRLVINKRRK